MCLTYIIYDIHIHCFIIRPFSCLNIYEFVYFHEKHTDWTWITQKLPKMSCINFNLSDGTVTSKVNQGGTATSKVNQGHPNWNKSHKPGCSLGREKCVREEPESRTSAYSHPLHLPFLTSPWDTACNTHMQQNQMPWPFKLLSKLFFLLFNPFTAQACKISRLKDACIQTEYFPVR